MRPRRSQPQVPTRTQVRKLAQKCRCGKQGYLSEAGAMDAVISGRYARAGVRVYQCESGLWHTTSKARVRKMDTPAPGFEPHASPVGELSDAERTLIHAVRYVRRLRKERVKGPDMERANNAAQAALGAAMKLSPR